MAETEQHRRVGKFELHEPIGEGAMGAVWRAYDSVIRRYVALKLLSRAGRTADARERLLREAPAAGALQHPNIVTIYDLGETDGQLFIAMELVDGHDLSTLIALSEPLPLERKLDLVIDVLQGLSYAHERGVIHRDIKPSNVRIASDGSVKIRAFGTARLQSADVTGSGAIVGTPTYMAPEQITNGAITPATDVFAVGCLLYELLGYRKPFEGETVHGVLYQVLTTDPKPLRTMAPSIPAALERVVGKALNKVPEERYETARQMQSALFSIRAALSGATDTTERLSLRWTPIPAAVLRLVTHAPIKWRAAVLTALMVTALVLLYVSRSPSPVAALPDAELTGATLDQLLTYPMPAHLNAALVAQRDSALAARDRARHAGAMKNNVPSLILAAAVVQNAERALRTASLQPPEARAAIAVLLQDLERAVSSERVGNLQVLMPGMAEKDVGAWQGFFQRYTRLTARYTLEQLSPRADTAYATVRTVYLYVPAGGGAQRETRLRQVILFTRTPNGWRVANIREAP